MQVKQRRFDSNDILTMLRDDGAGGDDNDGPVELGLELGDDLLGDLAEGGERAEGHADEEGLALVAVGLREVDELGRVDEDLGEVLLEGGVVDLELEEHLGALVLDVGRLGLRSQPVSLPRPSLLSCFGR